jgi:hypothetical protein
MPLYQVSSEAVPMQNMGFSQPERKQTLITTKDVSKTISKIHLKP